MHASVLRPPWFEIYVQTCVTAFCVNPCKRSPLLSQPCVLCTLAVRVCAWLSGQKRIAARTEGPVQDRATRAIRVALSPNCMDKKLRANKTSSECERRAKTPTSQNGLRANARGDHSYRMQGVLCILEPYVRP